MSSEESPNEMQEIIQEFVVETHEILEGLDQCFVALEENPGNRDLLNEIFRAVHSVKGSAGFLGFTRLVEVAHHSESVLNKLRQGEMQPNPEMIDIILESIDILKGLLNEVRSGGKAEINTHPIRTKLELLMGLAEESREKEQAAPSNSEPPPVVESVNLPQVKDFNDPPEEDSKSSGSPIPEVASVEKREADQTIRVDTTRLDQVMNLVGELVLGRNRLMKIYSELEEFDESHPTVRSLGETVAQLNLITTDLQLAVMKTRMQPIRKVFNKFPRMVRDMSRKVGKKVTLELSGEETELDKSVIEEIGDPLVHLIRNSMDHGIESPQERIASGKSEVGTIRLSAYQEGDSIVVEVEDDGKGIDPSAIERKAKERGFLKDRNTRLSDKDLIHLIFTPGFSTSEKITDISGRGVGMDVVKTNVTRMNGIIDINSQVGKGTRFTIKIPLTLAIIHVLMVKVEEEIYAIPLSSIVETVRITQDDIQKVDGQEVLCLRDQLIPLLRLGTELDVVSSAQRRAWIYVVLVALAEKRVGIIVDALCHQEEVVIKSIGQYLSGIQEISGATITGDGKVGLILDIATLVQRGRDCETV